MTAAIDDRGRRAAASLRERVDAEVDADRSLEALLARPEAGGSPATEQQGLGVVELPPGSARARLRWIGVLAVAAAIVAAVLLPGLVNGDNTRVDLTPPADNPPTTVLTPIRRAPDLQAASAQGAFVTLVLDPNLGAGADPCQDQQAVVTETLNEVTIDLIDRPSRWTACESGDAISWGQLELGTPLGTRPLIDASDGQPIDVMTGPPALFPTWAPPDVDLGRWTTLSGGHFSFDQGNLVLQITSSASNGGGSCGPPRRFDLRGTRAWACVTPERVYMGWEENTLYRTLDLEGTGATLENAVRVAESLQPLGP